MIRFLLEIAWQYPVTAFTIFVITASRIPFREVILCVPVLCLRLPMSFLIHSMALWQPSWMGIGCISSSFSSCSEILIEHSVLLQKHFCSEIFVSWSIPSTSCSQHRLGSATIHSSSIVSFLHFIHHPSCWPIEIPTLGARAKFFIFGGHQVHSSSDRAAFGVTTVLFWFVAGNSFG